MAEDWSPWSGSWHRRAAETISKANSIVEAAATYLESGEDST
jgi:hypothetical protein